MSDNFKKLRDALAAQPTPGPWDVLGRTLVRAIKGDLAVPIFESVAPVDWHKNERLTHRVLCRAYADETKNAKYIAAADPATTKQLLEKYDELVEALELWNMFETGKYAVVPRTPSQEMIEAGEETFVSGMKGTPVGNPVDCYAAMIKAFDRQCAKTLKKKYQHGSGDQP